MRAGDGSRAKEAVMFGTLRLGGMTLGAFYAATGLRIRYDNANSLLTISGKLRFTHDNAGTGTVR